MQKKFVLMVFVVGMISFLGGCASIFPADLTEKNCRKILNPEIVVNPENFAENRMEIFPIVRVGEQLANGGWRYYPLKLVIPVSDSLVLLEYEKEDGSIPSDYESKKRAGWLRWMLVDLKAKTNEPVDSNTADRLRSGAINVKHFRKIHLTEEVDEGLHDYIEDLSFDYRNAIIWSEYGITSGNGQKSVHIQCFENISVVIENKQPGLRDFFVKINDNEIIKLEAIEVYYGSPLLVELKTPEEITQISDDGKYVGFGAYLFNVETNRYYTYASGNLLFAQVHPGLKKATIIYRVIENHKYTTYISTIDIRLPE